MIKATSKAVKASRERTGAKSTSFYLSPQEKQEIDDLAERLGVNRKEALMRAVRAYEADAMSNADLINLIKKRLR